MINLLLFCLKYGPLLSSIFKFIEGEIDNASKAKFARDLTEAWNKSMLLNDPTPLHLVIASHCTFRVRDNAAAGNLPMETVDHNPRANNAGGV